jgi:hypothetical protein
LRSINLGKRLPDEHKEKIGASLRGKPHSESHVWKVAESRVGGYWYGNVTYEDIYCEIWNDVRPRILAFFGDRCVECGERIVGYKPCCHHIFYEKKACCIKGADEIFYSNLNISNHPKDYIIGKNPNYFVILCRACHSKTNGNFDNRKKWADHFKEIIDTKFGGKCYFTKEEMADLFPPSC